MVFGAPGNVIGQSSLVTDGVCRMSCIHPGGRKVKVDILISVEGGFFLRKGFMARDLAGRSELKAGLG